MPVATAQAHPNVLGAVAALHDLADQYRWMADLLEPGTRDRRPRHLSPAARATLNRQTLVERRDQVETARQGLAPRGTSQAPLVMNVLCAQMHALETVMGSAWLVMDALSTAEGRPAVAFTGRGDSDGERFAVAVTYLAEALPLVGANRAGTFGAELHQAARMCERVTGHGPDRWDRPEPCPACRGRFLVVTTWGTANAVVECTRCRCYGLACGCRRPGRVPGLRHVWQAAEFDQLGRLLGREASA